MRKTQQLAAFIACATFFLLCSRTNVSATIQSPSASGTFIPYPASSLENPVSLLVRYSSGPSLSSGCGGSLYIAPEDKQLMATALTAQAAGLHVFVIYDDAGPSETFGPSSQYSGGTVTCKLLGIFIDKTSY